MQRVTITLDDDLLETLDSLSQRQVITTVPRRSAMIYATLWRRKPLNNTAQGFAVPSYVYEHENVT